MVMSSIWLALALASQPAAAPVTVEIVAIGHSETPATRFVLAVSIFTNGDTEAKARDNVAQIRASLIQQLAAIGVTLVPDDGNATATATAMTTMDAAADATDKPEKPSASDSFSVRAATRAAITQAQAVIARTTGASADQPPVSSITDVSAAARAAKTDAIAKAKLDAQNYADALGYTGASVVSVTERGDVGTFMNYALVTFGGAMSSRTPPAMFGVPHGDTVPIDIAVTVTFRLEGKK